MRPHASNVTRITRNSKAFAHVHRALARRSWPALLLALWSSAAASTAQTIDPARAPAPLPGWSLSLDAQEGWDSNVRFSAPEGPGDLMTRVAARLDRTWSGRRGRFALSGGGQGSVYREVSDLNRFTYTGDADGSYLLSPRAAIRVSDAFRASYASELAALTGSGLLLPPVLSHANTARGGLSYAVSRRTTALLDLQHETVSFDDPSLLGGSTLSAGAGLSHELTRADTVGAGFQYQLSSVEGEHAVTETLHATWSRAFGTNVHARAKVGASRFQPLTVPTFQTTPVGGAGVDARWGAQTIEARYDRFVDLAYGLGRIRINGLFSGRYSLAVTPALLLDVRAIRGLSRDPVDASFALTNTDLVANLRYAVGRGVAVVGSYSRRKSVQAPSPPVSSQGAAVFLSYERAWR